MTRTSSLDAAGKSDRMAASIRLASSISLRVRFRRLPEGHSHVSLAFKQACDQLICSISIDFFSSSYCA